MNVGAEARDAALREITEFGELQAALEDRDAAQEELRKCQQDAIQLQARLAEAEALLRECRHFVKALCDHDDETCGCYQHIVLRGIDAFLTPDSASDCAHEWVNASNFEPGPNERCWKCNAIRRIADQPGEVGK